MGGRYASTAATRRWTCFSSDRLQALAPRDQSFHHRWVDHRAACHRLAQCAQQLFRITDALLEQIGEAGSCLEQCPQQLFRITDSLLEQIGETCRAVFEVAQRRTRYQRAGRARPISQARHPYGSKRPASPERPSQRRRSWLRGGTLSPAGDRKRSR